MSASDNEPGKTYDIDDRRRAAALEACEGLPTEWLERGFIKQMYTAIAAFSLSNHMGERDGKTISFPEKWWDADIRAQLDALNNIAKPERLS